MSVHEESKAIHRNFTKLYSEELKMTPEEADNKIYQVLFRISPRFSGLSAQQIVKAIEDKDPEILAKAYQTLEDHYKNPQISTNPNHIKTL